MAATQGKNKPIDPPSRMDTVPILPPPIASEPRHMSFGYGAANLGPRAGYSYNYYHHASLQDHRHLHHQQQQPHHAMHPGSLHHYRSDGYSFPPPSHSSSSFNSRSTPLPSQVEHIPAQPRGGRKLGARRTYHPYSIANITHPTGQHREDRSPSFTTSPSLKELELSNRNSAMISPERSLLPNRLGIYECDVCGKSFKQRNCLYKHRWEHSAYWDYVGKLAVSKLQQVQILEAAQILVEISGSKPRI